MGLFFRFGGFGIVHFFTRDSPRPWGCSVILSFGLGVSLPDRAAEPPRVGVTIFHGGGDGLHGLVSRLAATLLRRRTVAHFGQIGAIALDDRLAAGRSMAG